MLFRIERIDGQEFGWGGPERAMFKRNSKLRSRLNIEIICRRESELKTEAILEINHNEPKFYNEVKCIQNMLNNLRSVFKLKEI